ncbi:MAG: bifunctional 2-polyprenyl-6-hydroxyphenol methylase/3-demethylubiquinol 3-O-methyltransferase UbiG [Burkholderiaceae bacterium]|jgi:2-polyprenyl-6-hydroxyphenyl methylase/3-demethylubiquinone-9 3-methyltransferase|nr:bifunctional 2-polyprenyl-6-hydroxyphenol methylase/3-demethylubiquinol 3-O-methyltransferase UbiG [Burkholderiaceae bacterium]
MQLQANANVDAAELRKFGDLAARWWDPQGPMRPLHEINPARLVWIDRLASLAGKRVLDVGCGGGVLAEAMAARGATVTGIDLAGKPLKVAQLHALESGATVSYAEGAAEDWAQRHADAYDVVTCMEMLEHVPDPASSVRACATLARPGGWLFFSTINRNPKAFALAIVGAEYVLNLLPRGTHEYAKFIKPSELTGYARDAGLELKEMAGLTYNPFTKSARLGSDTDVNYLMAFRKPA